MLMGALSEFGIIEHRIVNVFVTTKMHHNWLNMFFIRDQTHRREILFCAGFNE